MSPVCDSVEQQIARAATASHARVACAESLTSGSIAARLGAAPQAATWFRGGIVTYAAQLLTADHVVAVSGVGGPHADEGQPAGTVWFGLLTRSGLTTDLARFDGNPEDVVRQTTEHALQLLAASLDAAAVDQAAVAEESR